MKFLTLCFQTKVVFKEDATTTGAESEEVSGTNHRRKRKRVTWIHQRTPPDRGPIVVMAGKNSSYSFSFRKCSGKMLITQLY